MHNYQSVIRHGLSRADEADTESHEIAQLFEALSNAIRHETNGLVELHLDQSECATYREPASNTVYKTRIVVRRVFDPSKGTVLARGDAAIDGGLPYELSLNHACVGCEDLDALEANLCDLLATAAAGKAIRDLMLDEC